MDTSSASQTPRCPIACRSGRYYLIAALLSVLVVSLAGFALWQEKLRYRERALVSTQNIARLLDQQITGAFDRVDLALQTSRFVYANMLSTGTLNAAELNRYLAQQESLLPEVSSIRITDQSGRVVFGSGLQGLDTVDLSDRPYFIQARDHANASPLVYGPIFARITKKWAMVLARRLDAPDGSFAGVVYANLLCEHFDKYLSLPSLGPKGAATLRTGDLALVHRFPATRNAVGSKDVSLELRATIAAQPEGGAYVAVTKLDDIERSNAYLRLKAYPFYVLVGQATDDYLQGWRHNRLLICALAGLTLLVTWFAVVIVRRSQRELNEDIQMRIEIDAALNHAMRELGERQSELEQANATLEEKVAQRTDELSRANHELERLARRDALTRLGNRLSADEHLHEEFLRLRRTGSVYSLLLIDIDHFKQVNDTYGHEQGDVVLKRVASTLSRNCRATDFVARFGGEEFLAILPNTSAAQAAVVAEKMREAVARGESAPVGRTTISIGVSSVALEDLDETTALRRADQALYKAKGSGRNQVASQEAPA